MTPANEKSSLSFFLKKVTAIGLELINTLQTISLIKFCRTSVKITEIFYAAPTQNRSYGDVLALLVDEDLGCPSVHFLGTNGHLCRTTHIP
jgi:hypothetical protein